jgi:uncharacterized OB-fold protein
MESLSQPLIPQANRLLSGDFMRPCGDGIELIGQRCQDCGKTLFPKTGVCPSCRSENVHDQALAQVGTLYSWSVVHVAPKEWRTPYTIGYVDLPDNVRVFAHIGADPQQLRCDMPVKVAAADIGLDENNQPRPFFQFLPA